MNNRSTYNEVIIPQLGVAAVQQAFRMMFATNEVDFRKDRTRLVDFYMGEQTDQDYYLKKYFNKETDTKLAPDYPHNLVLSTCNITSKLVDKKAKNYITQPVRKVGSEADEDLDMLLLKAGIKTTSKMIERMTWLLGDVAVVVVADADTEKIRFDIVPYYRPIFKNGDNVNPVAILYPAGVILNKEGNKVEAWHYWDEEVHLIFEGQTWNILVEEENMHGCFNVLFTHRMKPIRGHWTKDAEDLVDANRDVNMALTNITNALRFQAFPILAALGVDVNQAQSSKDSSTDDPERLRKIKIGFDRVLSLVPGADGSAVDLKFIAPTVDWDQLMGVIKTRIELLASSWNVSIQWAVSGDLSSGVALKILSIDNTDDKNEMQELLEEFFEQPLFEILTAMSETISWVKVSDDELTIDWAEEDLIESPTEELARQEKEIALNLTNPIDIMKADNPDLDDMTALALYVRNARINSITSKTAEPTFEETMARIMAGDTGVGLEDRIKALEGGTAPPPPIPAP